MRLLVAAGAANTSGKGYAPRAGSGCATPWVFGGGFEHEFMRGNRCIAPQLWKRCARLIPPGQAAPDVDEVGSHRTAHIDEFAVACLKLQPLAVEPKAFQIVVLTPPTVYSAIAMLRVAEDRMREAVEVLANLVPAACEWRGHQK